MQQSPEKPSWTHRWGIPASAAAHALLLALLVFGLPLPQPQPPKEEAVSVELVPPPEPKPEEPKPEQPKPEEPAAEQPQEAKQPDPAPEGGAQPVQALRPVFAFGEQDTGPRLAEDGGAAAEPATPPDEPPPDPEPAAPEAAIVVVPEPKPPVPLTEARKLYSQSATGALTAMNAMGTMSRGERAGELCASELREQLLHAEPSFSPDLLPSYKPDEGTVMEVPKAAFRAGGQWYDLRFRCEIDAEATRVLSFAFDVGAAIPRGEWKSRGFPSS